MAGESINESLRIILDPVLIFSLVSRIKRTTLLDFLNCFGVTADVLYMLARLLTGFWGESSGTMVNSALFDRCFIRQSLSFPSSSSSSKVFDLRTATSGGNLGEAAASDSRWCASRLCFLSTSL